ncbi:hypothetical protein KAJ27_04900 [bacterium]|nr:hypothetical protein [bacterium]
MDNPTPEKWYGKRLINRIKDQHIGICFKIIRKSFQSKFKTGGTVKEVAQKIRFSPTALMTLEKGVDDHIKNLLSLFERLVTYFQIDIEDFAYFVEFKRKVSKKVKKKKSSAEKKTKRLNVIIKNGLEEALQVRIHRTGDDDIEIELFDTTKKRSGALWIAPAVQKFDNATEIHMPVVKKTLRQK